MARKGLRLDLRAVFREAVEKDQPVTRENVPVDGDDGRVQMITVTVEPLIDRSDSEPLYLVLFSDDGPSLTKEDAMNRVASPDSGTAAHLDRELRETRERLQSLIEEYETALEELKSSNEELVSVNEELQSTNEELEASKEELQSLNEELHTVNAELNGKIEALDQANSDLQNLFDSTEIATVFLDSKLTIRSFTPAVSRIFSILASDRGRPITDLSSRVLMPGFLEVLSAVLVGGKTIERRIEQEDAAHLLLRVSPYRNSSSGQLDGIVVTFIDVTLITVAEMRQRVLIAELNHRVKNMLTIAIGLAHQTLKTAPSMEDFKESFISRLHAMARSYELVARDNWTKAAIQELIEMELSPFGLERVSTQGPPVDLKPSQALSFGMVLHELATNAGKYGALSTPGGRAFLSWSVTNEEHSRCEFVWSERGGPEVEKPKRRGFGVKLIENEVRYNLGGTSRVEFEREGLTVRIGLNLEDIPEE